MKSIFGNHVKYLCVTLLLAIVFISSLCVMEASATDAVSIGTAEELIALMNDSSMWTGDYVLTADIDLTDVSGQAPIGNTTTTFKGTFDGQGYSVEGLNLTGYTSARVGLFGCIDGDAIVKNLTVYGEVSSSGAAVGGIVGIVVKNASVINCVNYCNVTGNGSSTLIGGVAGTIRSNSASSNAKIIDCKNYGTVTGSQQVGGITGAIYVYSGGESGTTLTVSGCANYGEVKSSSTSGSLHGGITGYIVSRANSQVKVENCLNAGDVNAGRDVGGIVGRTVPVVANSIITENLMNTGDIYAATGYVGGFLGYHDASYDTMATSNNCFYTSGTVSAGSSANASYVKPVAGVPRASVFTNAFYLDRGQGLTDTNGAMVSEEFSVLESTFLNFDSEYWLIGKYGPELLSFHNHELEAVTVGTDGHCEACYCGYATDIAEHVDEDGDNSCEICGEASICEHTYVVKEDGTYYCANGCGLVDAAPEAPVVVSVSSIIIDGDEVTVTVSVTAASPIVAHSFRVDAPDGFTLTGVEGLIDDTDGWTFIGSDYITSPHDSSIIKMDMEEAVLDCAVARYTFTAMDTVGNGTHVFTVDALETYNYAEEDVEAVSVDAELTYTSGVEVVLGDVNGDEIVTVADGLIAIKAYLNGQALNNADMDGNGELNLIDILRIFKIVVK